LANRSLLFVQPNLKPAGGGNAVAAWILHALAYDYRRTLLTLEVPDFDATDRFYGTSLGRSAESIEVRRAAPIAAPLVGALPMRLDRIKSALLNRAARRLAPAFDLTITADHETDLGVSGIQYVHFPSRLYRPAASPVARVYAAVADRLDPRPAAGIARNRTLVNSAWVAGKMREAWGVESQIVYPPVAWSAPARPWAERANGIVTIGRLAPEKDFEKIVRIVDRVRAGRHDLRLHIVGSDDPAHRPYARRVRAAIRSHAWITLHEQIARVDLERLIATNRYGIHGTVDEHFGIAIAEMIRGGAIVFAAAGGGASEIVDDPRLRYASEEAAVARIADVVSSPARQASLVASLAQSAERFAPDRFMAAIRDVALRLGPSPRAPATRLYAGPRR